MLAIALVIDYLLTIGKVRDSVWVFIDSCGLSPTLCHWLPRAVTNTVSLTPAGCHQHCVIGCHRHCVISSVVVQRCGHGPSGALWPHQRLQRDMGPYIYLRGCWPVPYAASPVPVGTVRATAFRQRHGTLYSVYSQRRLRRYSAVVPVLKGPVQL